MQRRSGAVTLFVEPTHLGYVTPLPEADYLREQRAKYGVTGPEPTRRLDYSSKPELLRAYAQHYGLRTLVETGTHEGHTVQQILRAPAAVDRVFSVEIGDVCNPGAGHVQMCAQRFAGDHRVRLFVGDSAEQLPAMLACFEGPHLAWLDAHANGCEDPNEAHFPLKKELAYLFGPGRRPGSVVLVDDLRFAGMGWWPTLDEIRAYDPDAVFLDDIARMVMR